MEEESLVDKTYGHAIVDTGCTGTVCGYKWLDDYLQKGGEILKELEPNDIKYRFGDGRLIKTQRRVALRVKIGKEPCALRVNVLQNDLPMLMSIDALTRLKAIINCEEQYIQANDEKIPLKQIKGGHLCINLQE